MEELISYTEKWLIAVLVQGKRMDGHDFNSMWWQNSKELRASGVLIGSELDGIYYALCLIDDHFEKGKYDDYSESLHRNWDFLKDRSLNTKPGYLGHKANRTLIWNLWWQMKEVKKKIDQQLANKP